MRYAEAFRTICQFSAIPTEEWLKLEGNIEEHYYPKGTLLLTPEQTPLLTYFVRQGVCRIYYLSHDGKEFTKQFHGPGDLLAALAELITAQPSRCFIEAVTDVELLSLPYSELTTRYNQASCWQKLGRKLAEHFFLQKEEREFELLQLSADDRYDRYLKRFSALQTQPPQFMIASYLGITAVGLSRLISRRKKSA